MNGNRRWLWLVLLCVVLGCSSSETPEPREVRLVCTTFYPTTYFTQRIAGDRVSVACLLPADEDPIFWDPSPATIEEYQAADLIVVNGADFEKWVAKTSLPTAKTVDTAAPLTAELLKFKSAVAHTHGAGGEHAHTGIDGHTWLDPAHAKVQADEIRKALARLLPEQADEFQTNFAALAADLDGLHQSLIELSGVLEDHYLLASHPAYNYLIERYGWKVKNLDLDPEAMPDEKSMAEIGTAAQAGKIRVILWESQPTEEIAARFEKDFGLKCVVFSPCEQAPEGSDYIAAMKENIARLREAVSQP